jgi:hypothetical protein
MRSALYPILFRRSLLSRVFEALSHYSTKALYDPSDLTSLYQSRTGGSTGAVDSVVGIMLDKSQMGGKTAAAFIAGQSRLESNGDFASDITGWGDLGSWTAGSAVWNAGKIDVTVSTFQGAAQAITGLTIGRWYAISVAEVVADGTASAGRLYIGGATNPAASPVVNDNTISGSRTILFQATATSHSIGLSSAGGAGVVSWGSVSLREIPGYHALAPSDAARPILRSASSKNYLDADGTDDWMNVFPTLNLGEQWWHVGGWRSAVSGRYAWTPVTNYLGAAGNYYSGTAGWSFRNAADGGQVYATTTATDAAHVATLERTSATSVSGRHNGATGATVTTYDNTSLTKAMALFNSQNSVFDAGYSGRFYGGAFGTGTLSSSDRALLERYVAGLTGVTL